MSRLRASLSGMRASRMQPSEVTHNVYYERQFRENERSTNKTVALVSFSFLIIFLFLEVLIDGNYSPTFLVANHFVFLPISIFLILLDGIALHYAFDRPWIKYMLLGGILLMCFAGYFLCVNYAMYLMLLPIFIASRYFNRRLLVIVSIATLFLFVVAVFGNLYLDEHTEAFQLLHEVMTYNPWDRTFDVLVLVLVPLGINIVFIACYAFSITEDGRTLIHAQAEGAVRIASVDVELDMAAEMQQTSLPAGSFATANGNFELSAQEVSAREVGGDFYDYFMVDEHTLCLLIADVSDKGVPAALFMMSAKKAIECAVTCSNTMDEAVALANRLICRDNKGEMFLTLWIGMIDVRTGKGKYANAGHMPPLVKRADGSAEWMDNEPDLFLGNFPDQPPAIHCFSLHAGEVLLLYTDGITDAEDGLQRCFGRDGLMAAAIEAPVHAEGLRKAVMEGAQRFSEGSEQFDDMTVLALECVRVDAASEHRFLVEADYEGSRALIDGVEALLIEVACPDDTRRKVGVIIDEIASNIAENAYDGEQDKQIDLFATVGSDYIELRVQDGGVAFNPLEHDDTQSDDELQIGGWGIYFVKQLADEVSYERKEETNVLSLLVMWGM